MNYMFHMSVDTALEFWDRVIARKADSLAERNQILLELVEEGKIKSVMATERSKDQIVHDAAKHYGQVLDCTQIKEENSDDKCD
jgi:hypothetical protein